MKTERITAGSLSELMRKAETWKAARPGILVINEGTPSSRGHLNLDDGAFFMDIEYEDPPSN